MEFLLIAYHGTDPKTPERRLSTREVRQRVGKNFATIISSLIISLLFSSSFTACARRPEARPPCTHVTKDMLRASSEKFAATLQTGTLAEFIERIESDLGCQLIENDESEINSERSFSK